MIEDAKHHFFAEQGAQRGHAEVDFRAFIRGDANTAVLWQPLLGDVHAAHDLQSRDQALVYPLREVHDLFQKAVEPMPHEHALFERFDVHVAGVTANGAAHDEIHEIDDGRGLAALFEPSDRLEHFLVHPAR